MNPNSNINPNQPQQQQPDLLAPNTSAVTKVKPKIGTLLVTAFISLILGAAAGYFSGSALQKTADNTKITEVNVENKRLAKQVEALSVDPSSKTGALSYLDITEWKIRMPLNDKYTDVVYRINNALGKNYVEISSAKLAKLSTCENYNGQIGTITRAKSGTTPETGKIVTGFDGQIYMYQQFEKTCTSNPQDLEAPFKASILEQFAKLEAMPTKRVTADN